MSHVQTKVRIYFSCQIYYSYYSLLYSVVLVIWFYFSLITDDKITLKPAQSLSVFSIPSINFIRKDFSQFVLVLCIFFVYFRIKSNIETPPALYGICYRSLRLHVYKKPHFSVKLSVQSGRLDSNLSQNMMMINAFKMRQNLLFAYS